MLKKCLALFRMMEESSLFTQLPIKERERLVRDLFRAHPHLKRYTCDDMEVGYEASWLMHYMH